MRSPRNLLVHAQHHREGFHAAAGTRASSLCPLLAFGFVIFLSAAAVARAQGEWFPPEGRSLFERMIRRGLISEADEKLLRGLFEDQCKVRIEAEKAWHNIGRLCALKEGDDALLADWVTFVAEQAKLGIQAEALGPALDREFGVRMKAVDERLQAAARAAEYSKLKLGMEKSNAAHGVDKADADLMRSLADDLEKAEWEVYVIDRYVREVSMLNREDRTLLTDIAKFVRDEVGKGDTWLELDCALKEKLGTRRGQALGAQALEQDSLWLDERIRDLGVKEEDGALLHALLAGPVGFRDGKRRWFTETVFPVMRTDPKFLVDVAAFVAAEVKKGNNAYDLHFAMENKFAPRIKAALEK